MEQMETTLQEKFQVVEDEMKVMKNELEMTNKILSQKSLNHSSDSDMEPENNSTRVFNIL